MGSILYNGVKVEKFWTQIDAFYSFLLYADDENVKKIRKAL
jgi:hypothetical protein